MASNPAKKEDIIARYGAIHAFDDILRLRAADEEQVPILGVPISGGTKTEESKYELFTGHDFDRLVNGTCQHLEESLKNFKPIQDVVALLAPTTLDWIVTFFALERMGFPVLVLSTRNTVEACENLIEKTDCKCLIAGGPTSSNAGKPFALGEKVLQSIQEKGDSDFTLLHLPSRGDYDLPAEERSNKSFRCAKFDEPEISSCLAMIFHSSGSTGHPKPVRLSHESIATQPPEGRGLNALNTLPWFHIHGFSTAIQAMWQRKTAYCIDVTKPVDGPRVVQALHATQPEILHTVPYTLTQLADNEVGMQALRKLQLVTSAGAPLSDEIGDKLVADGVNLAIAFGASEFGVLADTMRRAPGDDAWQYMAFYPSIRHFIDMRPVGGDQFEAVISKDHPAIKALNSGGPSEDYHSGDVFEKHPTIEDRWKSVGRMDDRVTLENGEKFAPLLFETKLKESKLVHEAICFGSQKPAPGVIVFVTDELEHTEKEDLSSKIWSLVQEANKTSADFAQIGEDMILIENNLDSIPRTDKRSVKRKEVLRNFAPQIEALYQVEVPKPKGQMNGKVNGEAPEPNADKKLNGEQQQSVRDIINKALQKHEHLRGLDEEADFFEAGMNSLQAIQLDRALQRSVPEVKLQRGTTYKYANVASLTAFMEGVHLAVEQMKV